MRFRRQRSVVLSTTAAGLLAGLGMSFLGSVCGHGPMGGPEALATADAHRDPIGGHAGGHDAMSTEPDDSPGSDARSGHAGHEGHRDGSGSPCQCSGAMCCPLPLPASRIAGGAPATVHVAAPEERLILAAVPPPRPTIFPVPLPQPPPRVI